MPHIVFKQPNGKYGVWSTVVDGPIYWNASKREILEREGTSEFAFEHRCQPIDDAIDKGDIECCLYNGNYEKQEILDFFEDIKYTGPLVDCVKKFKREEDELSEEDWECIRQGNI